MITRHISAIVLFQMFALGAALLLSGIAARAAERSNDLFGGKPLPAILERAALFRDYGIWCAGLIIVWAIVAIYMEGRQFRGASVTSTISGILLVVAFLFLALLFLIAPIVATGHNL